jgi:hypothetical protein
MNQTPLAPMGVGKLLDRSFSVYRQHFGVFFLLALLLFGPLLLLQEMVLLDLGSLPLVMQETDGADFCESMADRFGGSEEMMTDNIGMLLLYLLVVMPLMTLAAYPQLLSAILLMTKAAIEGQQLGPKAALKQSFRRFWPLVGATVVYMLVAIGIMLAFALVCFLLFFLVMMITGSTMEAFINDNEMNPVAFAIILIIGYMVFLVGITLVPGFFLLRWGFYLPYVLLEGDGVALGKSWKLTKGSFWRLLALYVVLVVLYSVFYGGIQALTMGVMGTSVLSQMILILLSCLLTPWMMIVYALAYLDMRVRTEGTDLQAMLNHQVAEEAVAAPAEEPKYPHE